MRVSTLFLLLSLNIIAVAQPKNPGTKSGDADQNANNDIDAAPISGIEWLLLSGGLLGTKKVISSLRKRKTASNDIN